MAVYGLSHSVTLSTLKVYETPYMAVQPYSVQYDKVSKVHTSKL